MEKMSVANIMLIMSVITRCLCSSSLKSHQFHNLWLWREECSGNWSQWSSLTCLFSPNYPGNQWSTQLRGPNFFKLHITWHWHKRFGDVSSKGRKKIDLMWELHSCENSSFLQNWSGRANITLLFGTEMSLTCSCLFPCPGQELWWRG